MKERCFPLSRLQVCTLFHFTWKSLVNLTHKLKETSENVSRIWEQMAHKLNLGGLSFASGVLGSQFVLKRVSFMFFCFTLWNRSVSHIKIRDVKCNASSRVSCQTARHARSARAARATWNWHEMSWTNRASPKKFAAHTTWQITLNLFCRNMILSLIPWCL